MPDETRMSAHMKVVTILLLLANYAMTVNAAPLGTADIVASRFYWILLVVVLAVLAAIYYLTKSKSPVEVVGLAYDKSSHRLELTVKNAGEESYCIKSALRLLQPAEDVINSATSEGKIPMATAKASVGNRQLFQLLCEDESPVMLEPNETRTLSYDIMLPQEFVKLDATKNVEVHIAYSEEAPETASSAQDSQASDGFCIKMDSGEVVAEVFLLEDLLDALKKSPDQALSNHLKDGNDFALWIRNVIGDRSLAEQMEQVEYETPTEARTKITQLLDAKVESLKHPFLRKVKLENKFILKSGHDTVLSEIQHLEELAESLAKSPAEAVAFHTREGNDFAAWVKGAVGDTELAQTLETLKSANPAETKDKVVSAIRERVDSIKCANSQV
jgi:hypothetical protein